MKGKWLLCIELCSQKIHMNSQPPDSRTWPYLEIGSIQMSLVKMRSLGWALYLMWLMSLWKGETWTQCHPHRENTMWQWRQTSQWCINKPNIATWCSVCVQVSPSYKDTGPTGLGSSASAWPHLSDYIYSGSISKYDQSHFEILGVGASKYELRVWGVQFILFTPMQSGFECWIWLLLSGQGLDYQVGWGDPRGV